MKKKCLLICLLCFFPWALYGQDPLFFSQSLIQIDTTNPPGNEIEAASQIQTWLKEEGIESDIIESSPGRGNLIARLKGNNSGPSLALLGHLDVVAAQALEWDFPPFGGFMEDNFLYGRGALDMKGMVAMELSAFIRAKKDNLPLKGDLVLILVADEETGGALGAGYLVQNHWDKIRAQYLLNEGSIGVLKEGMHLYPIQIAEKGVAWMKLTAKGTSGHGSMPHKDNAVVHLTRALQTLNQHEFPIVPTQTVKNLFTLMAPHLPFPKNWVARYFFHPLIGPLLQRFAKKYMTGDEKIAAILSNTLSPTVLQAGYKTNVIPSEAIAEIDARIVPGETPEGFLKKIQAIIGDKVNAELLTTSLPNESTMASPFYETIRRALTEMDPQAIVTPMMSSGATDSRFFREKGTLCYGIIPLLIAMEDIQGMHGKNERVPVDGLKKGTDTLYRIIQLINE